MARIESAELPQKEWIVGCTLKGKETDSRKKKKSTVHAETSSELILERAGLVIFKTALLELTAFRLIPAIYPVRRAKPENYWKQKLIPDMAYPAMESVIYLKLIPGNIFLDPLSFGPDRLYQSAQGLCRRN